MYGFILSFWTEFGFCDVYGVRKVVWVCSMSEVPPKGEIASGILLLLPYIHICSYLLKYLYNID